MYSNNFYTDQIFLFLGGRPAFQDFMYKTFSADKDEIDFHTGSGLGENKTTCELTLRVLDALKEKLVDNNLVPQEIMSVAGIDKGTLERRFNTQDYNQYLIAKTGTLRHTSTLAGFVNDQSDTIFGIFNHTYNLVAARSLQNSFIEDFIDGTEKVELNYSPQSTISIKNIIIE